MGGGVEEWRDGQTDGEGREIEGWTDGWRIWSSRGIYGWTEEVKKVEGQRNG